MSILTHILDQPLFSRPSRIHDQHFGIALHPEDFLQPITDPQVLVRCPAGVGYIRKWKSAASEQDVGSTVSYGKDKFQANLDVQQFKPEEITVKVTGENTVTVEGKHDEKEDEHGQIYRHFVRKYILPKNYDISKVESKLSSDGILSIIAPSAGENQVEHKTIPITHTNEPAKQIEK